jgi:hypothetical protein
LLSGGLTELNEGFVYYYASMELGHASKKDQVLNQVASFLSSALTLNEQGCLVCQQGSRASSEHLLRSISITSTLSEDKVFCSIPSLSLKKRKQEATATTKASLEVAAAINLAEVIEVPQNDVHNLPSTLVRNILESFMSLVESRTRSYLAALTLQSRKDPRSSGLTPILEALSAMSSRLVKPIAIVSSFRVIGASMQADNCPPIIAPLVQETVLDLNILGEEVISVVVSGSGRICGVFDDGELPSLSYIAVSIDTTDFLRSMMIKAREAVKRATGKISQMYLLTSPQGHSEINSMMPPNQAQNNLQIPNNCNSQAVLGHDAFEDATAQNDGELLRKGMPPPAARTDRSSISLQSYPRAERHIEHQGNGPIKGLDLLTRAARCLKHDHENEAFGPVKHQRQTVYSRHSDNIHQGQSGIEEV